MSPINKQSIQFKLQRLEKNIQYLSEYALLLQEQFIQDYTIHGAAMHYMVESIEIVIDVGNHLLAQKGESPTTYKDVILDLGKHDIIPTAFAQQNAAMTDFRNLIIHAYTNVEIEQVYEQVKKAPDVFTEFATHIQQYIESN